MSSVLKIYRSALTPSRNALVENIEYYLEKEAELFFTEESFQYQRLALDLDIIVRIPQEELSSQHVGNYVSITQDGKTWYYFVISYEWKSTQSLQLKLSIDSVNTFQNEFTFSDKTTVERQHMDRWMINEETGKCVRIIDEQNEELDVVKYKEEDEKIFQTEDELDWFLIYKTRDELNPENPNNPISCYCCADKPIIISRSGGGASQTLTTTDLPEGQYNYVLAADNPNGSFSAICDINYDGRSHNFVTRTFTIGTEYCVVEENVSNNATQGYQEKIYQLNNIKFVNDGTNIKVLFDGTFLRNGSYHSYTGSAHNVTFSGYVYERIDRFASWSAATNGVNSLTINDLNFTRTSYDGSVPFQYVQSLINTTQSYNIGNQITRSTIAFSTIDKTDSKIVKLIRIPYAPCLIEYDSTNSLYQFPVEWTYENGLMKLNDVSLSTSLESDIKDISLEDILTAPEAEWKTWNTLQEKDKQLESKLYNSQFTELKFAYDSFASICRLEAFNLKPEDFNYDLGLKFKQTNTINSKFLFDLAYNGENRQYKSLLDYENILAVSRNNEETIFSNDYLNYIRSGYNYDKKLKQEQANMSWLGATLSTIGAVASFASSVVTGAVGIAAGISLATSAVASFANAANSTARGQKELDQKLNELARQSSSVSGADDVDLMKYYSDNKLHKLIYKPLEYQENNIYQLLFYCGYKHRSLEKPDTNSRYWFNYVQCNPVFIEEENTPYNKFLDDIKARYAAGLTVYHWHPLCNEGTTSYDWEQKFENFETSLNIPQPFYKSMIKFVYTPLGNRSRFTNFGPTIDNVHTALEVEIFDGTRYTTAIEHNATVSFFNQATFYRVVNLDNPEFTTPWYKLQEVIINE